MWIDSHCHLNHTNIEGLGSPEDLVKNARDNGVDGMVIICCRIHEEMDDLLQICDNNRNVWCSVGTHPHDASNKNEQKITTEEIIEIANNNPKVIGVGESGFDYYYKNSEPEDQKASFIKHIHAGKETGLPLIIHTRDAEEDTYNTLKAEGACDGKTKVVMHCFSSNEWLAQKSIDEGFMMSFTGMITFKKLQWLRDIAKKVPLDQVMIETDSPYLSPEPHRGQTNQPANVRFTGQYMADLYNLTEQEFAAQTTKNFFNFFDKAKQD
ncbi:MAG: TatD family hydrolase [Pseudomonadota bacterium]